MTCLTSTQTLIPVSPLPALYLSSVGAGGIWYEICGTPNPNLPSAGQWHTTDLSASVPPDVIALDLRGILIITDGANSGDTSLGIGFRQTGTTKAVGNYTMQTCAVGSAGGARSNASHIVPVVQGCIDWFWYRGSVGEWPSNPLLAQYPAGASYGFNINIHAMYS